MKNRLFAPLLLFLLMCFINAGIFAAEAQEDESLPSGEKSLSLEECIRFAIGNSFEVKLARLDFLIAETDQDSAEAIFDTFLSANIDYSKDKRQQLSIFAADNKQTNTYSASASKKLPSGTELTLSLSDTRTWDNSGFISQNPAHTAEAALEVRQPLGKNIFGFIDRRNISVTSLAIQNANLDTKERIESLLADVEKAYWKWAFSKRSLEIYRDILEKAKNLHKANTKNYDIGLIEKGDFLASQANILIREKDVLIADNLYRRAEEKIKLLMSMDAAYRLHPLETLQYREIEVNLVDCLGTAFQKRRDYQSSKRELEMQKIVLQTKANERWPEIDLVASMAANAVNSKFSKATSKITNEDNTEYFAGVEISIPVENKQAKSEFKKATHDKEKAIITLKNIERTIITEIGDTFRDYVTYEVNLTKIIEAAKLQQEKLKEEEKRFNYGRSNTKRLIDYQQDYLNAELEVSSGLLDLEVARTNLEKALNTILEKYERML